MMSVVGEYGHWIALAGAIIAATGATATQRYQSQEQARHQEELTGLYKTKSNELAALNDKILKYVTGGDGFGYLHPLHQGAQLNYFLRHHGDYPIYDVSVRVYDISQARPGTLVGSPMNYGTVTSVNEWLPVFAVPHSTAVAGLERQYRVEIAARNGVVVQYVRLTGKDRGWLTNAGKILRGDQEGQALAPRDDFPKDEIK